MSEPNTKDPVSHSHARPTKPKIIGNFPGNFERTVKKNQLQQAIGEFSANEKIAGGKKESLLSDEDSVLHVGKEKRGTIITDTKRHRWRFTDAVKKSFGGWLSNKKERVEHALAKPEPKKVVAASHTRVETIKQAAKGSALADTDGLKVVRPTKPVHRNVRSSIRIKPKDIPTEIGDTKPHWTHIIEDKTSPVTSHTQASEPHSAQSSLNDADVELIEAPEKHLLLTAHAVFKPTNVQKTFRTPRVVHAVVPSPAPVSINEPVSAPTPARVVATTSPEPKPNTQPPPSSENTQQEPTPSVQSVAPETSTNDDVTPSVLATQKQPVSEQKPLVLSSSTITVLLATALIAVLAVSTTLWNLQSSDTTVSIQTSEQVIHVETTVSPMSVQGADITSSLKNTLAQNSGFVDVTPTDADIVLEAMRSWGGIFNQDMIAVAVGGFDDRPFIVLKTNSQEIGLAGMYALEQNIPDSLVTLYDTPSSARFITKKILHDEARVLLTGNGERLVYTVRTDGMVLITQNADDLAALIDAVK